MLGDISTSARYVDGRTATALDASPVDARAPVPFEHRLLPAVVVGRNILCSRLDLIAAPLRFPILGIVSAEAYRVLERGLLRQLSGIAGETLQSEFSSSRPFGRSLSIMLDLPDLEPGADTYYWKFVNEHRDNGWLTLIREYPVLGRLIAIAVEFWAEATAELFGRLAADSQQLAESFNLTMAPMQVSGFDISLGDRHRNGRSVVAVELACGQKVVYKPKPLALEAEFNRLLEWCNLRGASPDLKVTTVLDRGEYGWVEYLEHLPCEDEGSRALLPPRGDAPALAARRPSHRLSLREPDRARRSAGVDRRRDAALSPTRSRWRTPRVRTR